MPRIVSRENSHDKGGIRPDVPGRRDLDPAQAEDRPDPITGEGLEDYMMNIDRDKPPLGYTNKQWRQMEASARGRTMDKYLGDISPKKKGK